MPNKNCLSCQWEPRWPGDDTNKNTGGYCRWPEINLPTGLAGQG